MIDLDKEDLTFQKSKTAPAWLENAYSRTPPAVRLWLKRVLSVTAFGVLFLFFLPTNFFALPGFGLEASWRLILNRAVSEKWLFGDRLVWTYGPLGFLDTRLPFGLSRSYYAGFDLLILLLFFWWAVEVRKLKLDATLALACLVALGCSKELINELPSTAVFCLVAFLLVRSLSQPSIIGAAALIGLSILMFYFKMNFGLVVLILPLLVFLFKTFTRDRHPFFWLLIFGLEALLVWLLAAPLHVNLPTYLSTSLTMIGQYGDAMSLSAGRGSVSQAAVCLLFGCFLLLSLSFVRTKGLAREPMLYLLVGAVVLGLLFKTAIVRSDYLHHNKSFLFGLPLIALAFLLHSPEALRNLWRVIFLCSALYAGLLLVVEHGQCLIYTSKNDLKAFFPIDFVTGFRQFNHTNRWEDYRMFVSNFSEERMVPQNVLDCVGTNSVDVFPFEASLPLSSALNYQPRPIPQTYAAMGKVLEDRNLSFYRSPQAPRFVMYVLGATGYSIDGRYHLWDEPAVKRLLQQGYLRRLVFTNFQGTVSELQPRMSPVLLLERSPTEKEPRKVVLAARKERAGSYLVPPEHQGEIYAGIVLRKTLLARLVSFLYKGAPVNVCFHLDDGVEKKFRVVPDNLKNGVLVNYFADTDNPASTENYLCHQSLGNPKCLSLQISFERPWEYLPEFEVKYFYLTGL